MTLDEIHTTFHQELWKDFDSSKSFPEYRPILAHYTSVANLERMLDSNELWFSHPFAMNDMEELRFGIDHGKSLFRASERIKEACKSTNHYEELIRAFNHFFAELSEGALDIYIFCLSLHDHEHPDGRLSMWRGYGADGNGVAVVIDTKRLDVTDGPALIIAPVEYKTRDERLSLIDDALNRIADLIEKSSLEPSQMYVIAYAYLNRLIHFALYTKHKGFEEEQEWRAAYIKPLVDKLPGHDAEKLAFENMLGYIVTEKGVQPKLKLNPSKIPDSKVQHVSELVDHLILGPAAAPTAFERLSIERMLEKMGFHDLAKTIWVSETPYKPNK